MPEEILKSSAPDLDKLEVACQELVSSGRGSEVLDFARECALRGTRDDKAKRSVDEALRNIQRASRARHGAAADYVGQNTVRIVSKTYQRHDYREALKALWARISGLSSDPSDGTLDL